VKSLSRLPLLTGVLLICAALAGPTSAAQTAAPATGLIINEDGSSIVAFGPGGTSVLGMLDTRGVLNKPHLGAFDPASHRLYVGAKGSHLAVFDLSDLSRPQLVADLKPGGDGEIHWVVLAGGLVWLAHLGDSAVYAYDPANLTKPVVSLGKDKGFDTTHGAALRPGTDELWITNRPTQAPGFVLRVNVRTRQVVGGPLQTTGRAGDQPNNSGFTPDGKKAYVVNQGTGMRQVTMVDPERFVVTGQIELDEQKGLAPHALIYEPTTQRMFVIAKDGGHLAALDTRTDTVLGYVPIGPEAHGVTLGPDGLLYATSKKGNKMVVVEPRTLTVVTELMTAALNGPHQVIFVEPATAPALPGVPVTGGGGSQPRFDPMDALLVGLVGTLAVAALLVLKRRQDRDSTPR
jgi:DNA-binding beta-propeller fold protein YncE